jgi:hypothetical protein
MLFHSLPVDIMQEIFFYFDEDEALIYSSLLRRKTFLTDGDSFYWREQYRRRISSLGIKSFINLSYLDNIVKVKHSLSETKSIQSFNNKVIEHLADRYYDEYLEQERINNPRLCSLYIYLMIKELDMYDVPCLRSLCNVHTQKIYF